MFGFTGTESIGLTHPETMCVVQRAVPARVERPTVTYFLTADPYRHKRDDSMNAITNRRRRNDPWARFGPIATRNKGKPQRNYGPMFHNKKGRTKKW